MSLLESIWEELVNLGPRFAGTSASAEALTLIERYLKNFGFSPKRVPFTYQGWAITEKTELRIKRPIQENIEAYCFIWSPPTPECGIEGKLEWLGKHDIWGQFEWELFGVTDSLGVYIAYISGQKKYPAIPQALSEGYSTLPHFSIGGRDTDRFLSLLSKGEQVRVAGKISSEDKGQQTACNVRVRIQARNNFENREYLLITAHFDTLYNTCGAFDNGSGTALLLALAEWLNKNPLSIPVELLFTDAEEFNLSGSKSYCRGLIEEGELSRIKAVVNLDGFGRGDTLEIWAGPESFAIKIWPLLSCSDLGFKRLLKYPPPPGSDHTPFYNENRPVVMLTINDLSILHRPEDVIDNAKRKNLKLCFILLQRFLKRIASL